MFEAGGSTSPLRSLWVESISSTSLSESTSVEPGAWADSLLVQIPSMQRRTGAKVYLLVWKLDE